MNELWAAYAAALTLGATHALEVDHMVAVSAFVGGDPRIRPAASFGVRWGVGHSLVVLVAGALLAWSGLTIPSRAQRWAELGVGLALLGVGLWAWRNARRLHLHRPDQHGGHAHLHAHPAGPSAHEHPHATPAAGGHDHGHDHASGAHHGHEHHQPGRRHAHLSTLVGAVHGLSGTAPIVALIPVTLMPSLGAAIGYLLAFGVGTTTAMGVYAALAALAVSRAASLRLARVVAFGTAVASMAVGLWWLVATAVSMAG